MRLLFWFSVALAGVITVSGVILPAPVIPGVEGSLISSWYQTQGMQALVIGLVVGGLSAVLANRRIQHAPREHASEFLGRVGSWGLGTLCAAAALVATAGALLAAFHVALQISPLERVLGLLGSGKFFVVVGAGAVGAAFMFLIVTRFTTWGGQYALLRPNGLPNLKR